MTHPIGSACSFDPIYRYQIRVGPLILLLDTLLLFFQIHHCYRNASRGGGIHRILNAIRKVVEIRRQRNRNKAQDDDSDPQGNSQIATLLRLVERCVYGTLIRHIFTAMLILQYVKLCGFHGIPISFSLATGYFASWIIMEMILLAGKRDAMVESDQATLPNLDSISLPAIPETVILLVFMLQGLTIGVGGIMEISGLSYIYKVVPDSHYLWAISIAFPLFVQSVIFTFRFPSTPDATGVHSRWERILMRASGGSGLLTVASTMTLFYAIPFPYRHSWPLIVYLPYNLYLMVCYASFMFWRQKEGGGHERYLAMAQPGRRLGLSFCALAYAGELLFFYIFVFSPEGTRKDWWTEYLP